MVTSLREIVVRLGTIYVDGHQDYAPQARQAPGFEVCGLSWRGENDTSPKSCDWAWLLPDGKLVAGEEKKAEDLENSLSSRRLQRELRGLVQEADIALLGLRTSHAMWDGPTFSFGQDDRAIREVNKWLGLGRVVFLPPDREQCLVALSALVSILGDPTAPSNLSIVAGSDIKRPRTRDPFERALMRLFDGVGERTAGRIAAHFKGQRDFAQALYCVDLAEWKVAGGNKNVIRQLEELRKG